MATTADYLGWYVATHVSLTGQTARQRLAHLLVCLADIIGQEVSGGIELQITDEKLASAANITPFTASRLLSEWQRSRAIAKNRGKIVLRAKEQLFLRKWFDSPSFPLCFPPTRPRNCAAALPKLRESND